MAAQEEDLPLTLKAASARGTLSKMMAELKGIGMSDEQIYWALQGILSIVQVKSEPPKAVKEG